MAPSFVCMYYFEQARVRFKALVDTVDDAKSHPRGLSAAPRRRTRSKAVATSVMRHIVRPLLFGAGENGMLIPRPSHTAVAFIEDVSLDLYTPHQLTNGGVDACAVHETAALLRALLDHGIVFDTTLDRWRLVVRWSRLAACMPRGVFVCSMDAWCVAFSFGFVFVSLSPARCGPC